MQSHPKGYAEGGVVPGRGRRDTVPAMLTPGEIVLNADQQKRLMALLGGTHARHLQRLWQLLGIRRSSRSGTVAAHEGTQVHFHWFGEQNRWTQGEKQAFLNKAKAEGKNGEQIMKDHPWMAGVFAGTAKPGQPGVGGNLIHGPKAAPPAAPAAPGAPGADEEYLPPEEDLGGDGGDGGLGDDGGAGGDGARRARPPQRSRRRSKIG